MAEVILTATETYISSLGGEGILTEEDVKDLKAATRRVLDLMSDEAWHTAEEIELAAGQDGLPARSGLRRMRELRQIPGLTIDKTRLSKRSWAYKLTFGGSSATASAR